MGNKRPFISYPTKICPKIYIEMGCHLVDIHSKPRYESTSGACKLHCSSFFYSTCPHARIKSCPLFTEGNGTFKNWCKFKMRTWTLEDMNSIIQFLLKFWDFPWNENINTFDLLMTLNNYVFQFCTSRLSILSFCCS